MCTYLLLRDVLAPRSVALAANRDEALDRPFRPPKLVDCGGRPALLPLDWRGGTWLGTNGALLVALTNAPLSGEDPGRRSRGLLVRDLLACTCAEGARQRLREALQEREYNGFNLIAADADSAWLATRGDDGAEWRDLAPGAHLLHDRRSGSRHVCEEWAAASRSPRDEVSPEEALATIGRDFLSSHEEHPLLERAPCRHDERHGTVAATLAFLAPETPGRSFLRFADGPPCRTAFADCPLP